MDGELPDSHGQATGIQAGVIGIELQDPVAMTLFHPEVSGIGPVPQDGQPCEGAGDCPFPG